MKIPRHLTKLVDTLRKLPGVGSRSAERFAYKILEWSPADQHAFAEVVKNIPTEIKKCSECGALTDEDCFLCGDTRRCATSLCVVATFKDIFPIESTGEFKGRYHVLGGLLSPLDRKLPENLSIEKLKERVETLGIQEILLALDSTLEGDTTSLWIKGELSSPRVKISRLAFGLPMGSSLDYVDGGTLARALSSRREF